MIKKALSLEKGSGNALKEPVGTLTSAQVEQIAKSKMPDLNTKSIEGAMKIVEGTAKSMGVKIVS